MKDMAGTRIGDGQHNAFCGPRSGEAGGAEELVVAGGVVAALLVPFGQIA